MKNPDLRQKLYQMFILGTDGDGWRDALKNNLGGIIFFTYDIKTPNQFQALTKMCKDLCSTPPFLSIDQEGGRVERTENIHKGKKYLSARFSAENGDAFIKKQTEEISAELKDFGINMNFAPCCDVDTNPKNPIIGERSYSSNPKEVAHFAQIAAQIYRENKIIPCAKHFPGHGDADKDSHLTLPEISLDFETYEKLHIAPFKQMIDNGIETIMAAHLHVPYFEKEMIPTSLSFNALSYLRNELGFKGVILSDDMIMKGVEAFGPVDACEMGIRAGINVFIYRNSSPQTISIIENIYQKALKDKDLAFRIQEAYEKISDLKNKFLI